MCLRDFLLVFRIMTIRLRLGWEGFAGWSQPNGDKTNLID